MMDEFFVIQLINKDNLRGYLFDSPDGIKVITGGISAQVTQFATYDLAMSFIRHHKLERQFKFAFAKSSLALMDEKESGVMPASPDEQYYFIEGEDGRKCFIDGKTNNLYFTKRDVGFICFKSIKEAEDFLNQYEIPCSFTIKPMPKVKGRNDKYSG